MLWLGGVCMPIPRDRSWGGLLVLMGDMDMVDTCNGDCQSWTEFPMEKKAKLMKSVPDGRVSSLCDGPAESQATC
jgi:hypothetical protein